MKTNIILFLILILSVFQGILSGYAFSDSDNYIWRESVEFLQDQKLVNGYDDGTYRPYNKITRAEFSKIVVNAAINKGIFNQSDFENTSQNCFQDITEHWGARFICPLKNKGIINGTTGLTFEPNSTINQAAALKITLKVFGENDGTSSTNPWYQAYFDSSNSIGMSYFEKGSLQKNADYEITRGEMAYFINWLSNPEKTDQISGNVSSNTSLTQYTPDQANWSTFQSKAIGEINTSHDPDGIGWISKEKWKEAKWDGTVYDPTTMSKEEFATIICPSGDIVRGIREVFYDENPFADNVNPTKAEIDNWHKIAINHVRALVGYTSEDRQVQNNQCLSLRAHWGDERKFTTMWDSDYPGTNGSAAGPCQGGGNSHCGASFLPSVEDQQAYLPDNISSCQQAAGSEGIFNASKSNIPWSIKWSRSFCATLGSEGFWGGHTGPWFHREQFGFSFWDTDPNNNDNNVVLRAKWSGNLMPSLYQKP